MRTYIATVFSLIIHLVIFLGLVLMERFGPIPSLFDKHQFQEITNESDRRQERKVDLVLLETPPKTTTTPQTKALFLAAQTQRVQEQTKARFEDVTANRLFPSRVNRNTQPSPEKKEAATSPNGTVSVNATERLNNALATGISTLSESLPDTIKYGDFTALNTDQYLYFSFFSRIAPRIRFHWSTGVESVVESLMFRNFQMREEKIFTTEVEVKLDKSGYYQHTNIFRSSGVPALDQAVVRAFEQSTPFLNPPQEMAKSDGSIRLYYSFRVHFSPQLFARQRPD